MADGHTGDIKLEDLFNIENCDYCGDCLKKCTWMESIRGREGDLFSRLAGGEYVREILDNCTNCMSCNSFCSRDARPYGLIIYRWYERYKREGIPPVFKRAVPFHTESNVWSKLEKWMSRREQNSLKKWKNTSGAEEMLFLGCNQHYDPYIVYSGIFEGIPVFSDRHYCCGEPVFRLGLLDEARRCTFNLREKLRDLGVKRLIVFCPACLNTMTNLMPNAFGVKYDDEIELIPLVSWLKERINNGDIKIRNPLGYTVTIQDSCHGTGLGEKFLDETRDIFEMLGINVREMENSRSKMRCCGLGYAATRYSIPDVVLKGFKRLREAKQTGADITSTYCNGCYFTMNMMRLTYPQATPVYHLVELIQMATGEKPVRKIGRRRFAIVAAALESAGFELLKRERIKLRV